MALNPNHTYEELDGVKCSIVEKNCTVERVDFLKKLLEFNDFTVVVAKSPPPKTAAVKPPVVVNPDVVSVVSDTPVDVPPAGPETFTLGVTDLSFNPTNAVFNRELKTPDGHIVSSNFWKQLETISQDQKWYWKN